MGTVHIQLLESNQNQGFTSEANHDHGTTNSSIRDGSSSTSTTVGTGTNGIRQKKGTGTFNLSIFFLVLIFLLWSPPRP